MGTFGENIRVNFVAREQGFKTIEGILFHNASQHKSNQL